MPDETTTQCGRCHRGLTSQASIRRGCGKGGLAKVLQEAREASADYSSAQVESAMDLIEDGAIVQVRRNVYRSVSSDGTRTYMTATTGQCNCPLRKPCYHSLTIRFLVGSVPAPLRMPYALDAPRAAAPRPPLALWPEPRVLPYPEHAKGDTFCKPYQDADVSG